MNAHDITDNDRNLFNRATLELTFRLLRYQRPALALQIQNTIVRMYPCNDYHTAFTAAELPLDIETIQSVTLALLSLSEELLTRSSQQRNDLVIVRSLLLDWLMLARECPPPAA